MADLASEYLSGSSLSLLSKAHARLHRFEDGLANKQRERDEDGRFI